MNMKMFKNRGVHFSKKSFFPSPSLKLFHGHFSCALRAEFFFVYFHQDYVSIGEKYGNLYFLCMYFISSPPEHLFALFYITK